MPVNKDNAARRATRSSSGSPATPLARRAAARARSRWPSAAPATSRSSSTTPIAAGYKGLIVFNRRGTDGCETLVSMLAVLGRPRRRSSSRARTASGCSASSRTPSYTCGTASETDGTNTPAGPSVPVDISAVFDGWGYTHMYKTDLTPGAKMVGGRLLRAAVRASSSAYAENYGDMTVHEVATDPGQEPRLRLALRARHARALVHHRRPQGGRRVRRGGRLQLLGRRGPQDEREARTSSGPTAIAACGSSRSTAEPIQDSCVQRGAGHGPAPRVHRSSRSKNAVTRAS